MEFQSDSRKWRNCRGIQVFMCLFFQMFYSFCLRSSSRGRHYVLTRELQSSLCFSISEYVIPWMFRCSARLEILNWGISLMASGWILVWLTINLVHYNSIVFDIFDFQSRLSCHWRIGFSPCWWFKVSCAVRALELLGWSPAACVRIPQKKAS